MGCVGSGSLRGAQQVYVDSSSQPCRSILFSLPALAGSSVQGINNFHQVDEHVYRGAQPTSEGFEYLAKIGVKTVLDLREHGERSRRETRLSLPWACTM